MTGSSYKKEEKEKGKQVKNKKADCVVVGGLAIDITCNINTSASKVVPSSYPGSAQRTLGGVGLNLTKASTFAGYKHGISTRLITSVGKSEVSEIKQGLEKSIPSPLTLDQEGIIVSETERTAQYIAMHDNQGDLIVACADMDIIKNMDPVLVSEHVEKAEPKCVLFDGNLGNSAKLATVKAAKQQNAIVGFEPTSVEKAAQIAEIPFGQQGQILQAYPNHTIDFSTPNFYELSTIHSKLDANGYFELDSWFPVVDALNLGTEFRTKMEYLSKTYPALRDLLSEGTIQKAVQILPYIPNLFIKQGANGVILLQLLSSVPKPCVSFDGATGVVSAYFEGRHGHGLQFHHFPAIPTNSSDIVSVTGAGDTLCGLLLSEFARNPEWINDYEEKVRIVEYAQKGASLTIQCAESVSPKILDL